MDSSKNSQLSLNFDNDNIKKAHIHKYSIYLQSKDSKWIQRNTIDDNFTQSPEPPKDDIRD